ncbi:MAG: DinB family protein [Crocinitomicaceae bacterium]
MKKEDIQLVPDYYQRYIDLVPDVNLIDALPEGGIKLFTDRMNDLQKLGVKTYAKGKWTIHEMLEHLMDTERIFQARALRFARNDTTELAGYDENAYVKAARSNEIPLGKLLMQYIAVRGSTLAMFSNFNKEELMRSGRANGQEISVLAIGFILIGHPIHHFKVLEEKYFPLIQ